MVNLTKKPKITGDSNPPKQSHPRPQKDTQSRSWTLTFQNIETTGYSLERIAEILHSIPSLIYFCAGKEIGIKTGRLHIHCYFKTLNPMKFSTLRNYTFKDADVDIQQSKGTAQENRDYCFKQGKWSGDPKEDQRLDDPNARVEWGSLPVSHKGKRSDLQLLYDLIKEGCSNGEILAINPDYMRLLTHIDRTRLAIKIEDVKDTWRNISCSYIYGATGAGKTKDALTIDEAGNEIPYSSTYRITNYKIQSLWDGYNPATHDRVVFDEFHSQIDITLLLVYIDGYPNFSLPSRYSDKVATYHFVSIISNIPLEDQYKDVQRESPETWQAFLRRINRVVHYKSKDEIIKYDSVDAYLHRDEGFTPAEGDTPFDK